MNHLGIMYLILTFLLGCSALDHRRLPSNWSNCFEHFMQMTDPVVIAGWASRELHEKNSLESLEQALGNTNLLQLQYDLGPDEIVLNNKNLFKLLDDERKSPSSSLGEKQVETLYRDHIKAPMVLNDSCYQDPKVELGYCFGRATIVHLLGLKRGIPAKDIKKIWVAGEMVEWGHHVAPLIKTRHGWMVVDHLLGKVITAQEWINSVQKLRKGDKPLMFFVTQGERFSPYNSFFYNSLDLFNVNRRDFQSYDRSNDYYRGFFKDFFEWFDKQSYPGNFK